MSKSSRRSNQCMNPFYLYVSLSVIWKSSNALVTIFKWICFRCGQKGHYVNKCPQRGPKDQPTKIGIATPQSIHHSKNVHTPISWEVRRCKDHKLLRIPHRPHRTRNATIVKKRDTLLLLAPIHVHVLLFHHQQR
jgi:hypothetical protein